MADSGASSAEDRALDALTRVFESAFSPETVEAQQIILRRLALQGSLFPSRAPAPLNITEMGGYLNLLQDLPELRLQVLASTLGVAGPDVIPPFGHAAPPIRFETRPNDRPAGPGQAAIPVNFTVRADFAPALDAAIAAIHDLGGTLPLLTTTRVLPRGGPGIAPPPPADVLALLGRMLELVPSAALVHPATDPLALGASAGPLQVLARQVDASAPKAATVTSAAFDLWVCTSTACAKQSATGAFIPVAPHLAAAGWHQPPPGPPASLASPGPWNVWTNVTGLVAGRSRLGDELLLLYPSQDVALSSLAPVLDRRWDGTAFVDPV